MYKPKGKFSLQARLNISEGHKGEKNYAYGKTRGVDLPNLSKEARAKLSRNHSGKLNPMYGGHRLESIAKMAQFQRARRRAEKALRLLFDNMRPLGLLPHEEDLNKKGEN